jgi:FSR family fosmidomycin resistance protein-like MFS transporter
MSTEVKSKTTLYPILFAISGAHLINDSLQSVIPASYPILQGALDLSYFQLGLITFVLYLTSSVMQPFVGTYADKRPSPFILPLGMALSLVGMLGLAISPGYIAVLCSVIFVGFASAIFHPEGSRIAYLAAGSRRGLAQSIYQVGGNTGSAMAPLMTALIFFPFGQFGAIWFTLLAGIGILLQSWIAGWYRKQLLLHPRVPKVKVTGDVDVAHNKKIKNAIGLILFTSFIRSWFGASIGTFFVFFLIEQFDMSIPHSQLYIFTYMGAGIIGTFFGGPLSDRIGRKNVIVLSLLGSVPFAILLPFANELWAFPLLFIIGVINHSSFSVSVVYVQELVPGRVGTVSGLVTGLSFGIGAIGAVVLGAVIDLTSLTIVIVACSYLPLLGVSGFFLPSDKKVREWALEAERREGQQA